MKRDKRCPSCATWLAGRDKRCPSCGAALERKTPEGDEAPSLEGFVELTANEPEEVQGLLDRLVAAGIEFIPVADPGADRVATKGSSGHQTFVSVYVRPAELDRAQAIEREWMRDAASAAAAPEADDASLSCPACGSRVSTDGSRCLSCGLEFPASGNSG